MSTFATHKVVSTLPATLEANASYAVRVGAGVDLYITDTTGQMAHKVNDPLTWEQLVFWPSTAFGTSTLNNEGGVVRMHTKGGLSFYRFIPSNYSATTDGFYTTLIDGVLSGLVATRG